MAIWTAGRAPERGLRELAARLDASPEAAWEWIERLRATRDSGAASEPRDRGAVATPDWVAERMAARGLAAAPRRRTLRVLDAGCGDGRLLVAAARAAARAGVQVACEGVEIDPAAARWAQGLEPLVRAGAGAALVRWRIRCEDFLGSAGRDDIDLAIVNPPYVTWRALGAATRAALRAAPRTDLALVFVERLLDRLRPGGALVAIVPNKLLVARYAAEPRRRWRDAFALDEIWDLSREAVFPQHDTYPVVLVIRRARAAGPIRVLDAAGAVRRTVSRRSWTAAPGALVPLDMDPRLAAIAVRLSAGPRLGDHVSFACGLATSGFGRGVGRGADRILRARDVAPFHTTSGAAFDPRRAGVAAPVVGRLRVAKIVVPGMFRRLCAAFDARGRVLGRVYWAVPRDESQRTLLLALLNSRFFALLYAGWFGGGAQSGAWLRANTPCLAALPWPERSLGAAVGACVRRLECRDSAADRERLDVLVESAFGLTGVERAVVRRLARNLPSPDAELDGAGAMTGSGASAR